MPPIIPPSLQPQQRGVQVKPPTVAEQRIIKQYGSLERGEQVVQQQKVQREVEAFEKAKEKLSSLSYDEYFSEYAKLSPEVKQYFVTPPEIKATPEFAQYQQQEIAYQQYQTELARYNKDVDDLRLARKVRQGSRMTITGGIQKWLDRISEGMDFVESPTPIYRTEQGVILGKGFLRPTPENLAKYGRIVEEITIDRPGELTARPISQPEFDMVDVSPAISMVGGIERISRPSVSMVEAVGLTARGELTPQDLGSPGQERERFKSGSIIQSYYELFGVKFYKEGEREKIIKETLKPFEEAQTYEEQQSAIRRLEAKGVSVTLNPEGEYIVDDSSITPTSKLGGFVIDLTDLLFKLNLFAPYMQTMASSKGKTKTKTKAKAEVVKKSSEKVREKVVSELDDIMIGKF